MTIKLRLLGNTFLVTVVFSVLILTCWLSMRHLTALKDAGAVIQRGAEASSLASRAGLSQYQAVAEAVLVRDLARADQEWVRKKEANAAKLDNLEKLLTAKEDRQLAEDAKRSFDRMVALYEGQLRPMLAGTQEITSEMRELASQIGREAESIRVSTLKLAEKTASSAKLQDRDYDATMNTAILWVLAIGLAGIILQIAAGVFIAAGIVNPLKTLNTLVGDLAVGEVDLTRKVQFHRKDELGRLGANLDTFIDKLHDMVKCVARDCIQVVISSNRVQVMSEKTGKEAEELSQQSTSVSTASEEMSATAGDIARSCVQAAERGTIATGVAAEGSTIVNEAVQGMNRIAELVRSAASTVESLGGRSDQIGQIVGTIEDIADQTNLLALNAAIEAARAGEQGRGFAVVADEVRALAERTTRATSEISAMIKSIQHETVKAVESMEQGVNEVKKGSEDAARSGEALHNIMEQINAVNMQISQIATAAEEQTATTFEISGSIQQINEIARKSKADIDETTLASNNMLNMSEDLIAILGKFTLHEDVPMVLNRAKCAHMLFIGKIKAHLHGYKKIEQHALPTHQTCAFGKWYQGKGEEMCGHSSHFHEIDAPHAEVHDLGKQVVIAYNGGDTATAAALAEQMTARSCDLIGIIERLETEYRV